LVDTTATGIEHGHDPELIDPQLNADFVRSCRHDRQRTRASGCSDWRLETSSRALRLQAGAVSCERVSSRWLTRRCDDRATITDNVTYHAVVSIVTPTLNQGRFIEATIRSVKGQTFRGFEHIVVDGGSTDETLEVLRRHEGTYPMRWLSEPDGGMYEAVNKGLRLARGEIVAYLNSDDLYFPWTIETVVRAFRRHPYADFVFGDALSVDDATGSQELYWMLPFDLDDIRRVGFLAQPAVFWHRAAYEATGPFDERLRYVADCEYWMRAGERHRFHKVNEFLAVERNHSSTLRETGNDAVWTELRSVRSRFVDITGWQHRLRTARHRIRRRLWQRVYWLAFLVQATVPPRLRATAWQRLLAAGGTTVERGRLLARAMPFTGKRLAGRLLAPSRHWLDPPAT
jgi:glycosyltransferase involved in cell wall biosynthesis